GGARRTVLGPSWSSPTSPTSPPGTRTRPRGSTSSTTGRRRLRDGGGRRSRRIASYHPSGSAASRSSPGRRRSTWSSEGDRLRPQGAADLFGLGGLEEVLVEAGLEGTFGPVVAREGDQPYAVAVRLPDAAGHAVAVEDRHLDVHDGGVGLAGQRLADAVEAVV